MSGISRDLHHFADHSENLNLVSSVVCYVLAHIREPLRLPELAVMVDLSVYQLDQRIRAIYQISAGQLITRARVDAACHLLTATGKSILKIATECGYSDQLAFSRQFKHTTGLTPKLTVSGGLCGGWDVSVSENEALRFEVFSHGNHVRVIEPFFFEKILGFGA